MFRSFCATIVLFAVGGPAVAAEPPTPLGALAKMPVKEVTVSKDGHAYVVHEGKRPTEGGNVLPDLLPTRSWGRSGRTRSTRTRPSSLSPRGGAA